MCNIGNYQVNNDRKYKIAVCSDSEEYGDWNDKLYLLNNKGETIWSVKPKIDYPYNELIISSIIFILSIIGLVLLVYGYKKHSKKEGNDKTSELKKDQESKK